MVDIYNRDRHSYIISELPFAYVHVYIISLAVFTFHYKTIQKQTG